MAVTTVSANPILKNELRSLPEKLKQKRIQQNIQNTFRLVQSQIIRSAKLNLTETNFTLFCLEPNEMQRPNSNMLRNVYRKEGANYKLTDTDDYSVPFIPLSVKPLCSVKMGYELYSRYYQYPNHSPDHPFYIPLDFSHNIPGISHKNLEDSPTVYLDTFFKILNQAFPDLSLTISKERTSKIDGLFESDCCPIYIVSW